MPSDGGLGAEAPAHMRRLYRAIETDNASHIFPVTWNIPKLLSAITPKGIRYFFQIFTITLDPPLTGGRRV